jgi:hypothetical protein
LLPLKLGGILTSVRFVSSRFVSSRIGFLLHSDRVVAAAVAGDRAEALVVEA